MSSSHEPAASQKRPDSSQTSDENVDVAKINFKKIKTDQDGVVTQVASPRPSLLLLPDELLTIILSTLYLDIFGRYHFTCNKNKNHLERCQCRVEGDQAWFWYSLPFVHPRIFALLDTAPSPIINLFHKLEDPRASEERVKFLTSRASAVTLAQVKHLRVNLADWTSVESTERIHDSALRYLVHIYFICLSATNMRTLELSDLRPQACPRRRPYDEGEPKMSPNLYEEVKDFPFDVTCSTLLKYIPAIFDHWCHVMPPQYKQRWSPAFAQTICRQMQQTLGSAALFPQLSHVYIMIPQNGDATVRDYANIFVKRQDAAQERSGRCDIKKDSCNCVSSCPSLSSLTIVMWSSQEQPVDDFWLAMAHLVRVHQSLTTIKVVWPETFGYFPDSRRLFAMHHWFWRTIVPMLGQAQKLLSFKVKVTVYLLTAPCNAPSTLRLIDEHRRHYRDVEVKCVEAGSDCRDDRGIILANFTAGQVHRSAVHQFRDDYARDHPDEVEAVKKYDYFT